MGTTVGLGAALVGLAHQSFPRLSDWREGGHRTVDAELLQHSNLCAGVGMWRVIWGVGGLEMNGSGLQRVRRPRQALT